MLLLETFNRPFGVNAWGQTSPLVEKVYLVEEDDRCIKSNYRGYNYAEHQINPGNIISVYTDSTNWTCWVFNHNNEKYREQIELLKSGGSSNEIHT